ncbi:hypothetical protein CHS0354_022442 [Potamilus streckersoni]|uniref:Uncharacterized protein n=1 Tax=Potamilus streckersoni TaxID=2493646 RepID=A0AAE0SXF2_9BIVA|nr:hypothetical protein CHS0354_022442 [Potamilus streckersoni]
MLRKAPTTFSESSSQDRKMSRQDPKSLSSDASVRKEITVQSQVAVKPSLAQVGKGPSLIGLLASKRFAKKLTSRFLSGRTGSMNDSSRISSIQKEPSYRLEPQQKFNMEKAQVVVKEVLEGRLEGFRYHSKFCANMSKTLSDEIKDRIKKLHFDRYKIVVMTHIGENKGESLLITSRCVWDANLDGYATYTYSTSTFFCTATVYCLYNE